MISTIATWNMASYTYDRVGRVMDVNDIRSKVVSYEHDDDGRRTKLTYSHSSYITYEYDEMDRLTKIKDDRSNVLAEYEYDELSRRTVVTYLNDANATYECDLGNRLGEVDNEINSSESLVYSYDTYDDVGNRLDMTFNSTDEHEYEYDNLYQLTDVNYPDASTVAYYYDEMGNPHSRRLQPMAIARQRRNRRPRPQRNQAVPLMEYRRGCRQRNEKP